MLKDFIKPMLVLTLICLVASGALALMDSVTHPVIEAAIKERTEEAMNEKIPYATGFERVESDEFPVAMRVYRTTNDVGYVIITSVNGFSGDITIICGVDTEGKIIAVSTLSHTETKGIGTIIEQDSYLRLLRARTVGWKG